MLFDLRSRGRRRTVQAVYLGLALLMGGGLVLFGVGAGNGFGGLLDAFKGGGGGSTQTSAVSQQEKTALTQTRLYPRDPAGWSALVQARWSSAGQGSNYNQSTNTFTAAGKHELAGVTQAFERYLTLVGKPDPSLSILAARAYTAQGLYAQAAATWETQTLASPGSAKGYECLAVNAYAAKQNRKGDLASQKALSLVPKAQRLTLRQQLQQAKTSPQLAQSC